MLVAAVGELYQGDLDLGRYVLERLTDGALGADVVVEDLSYGAVAVSQRLLELRPGALVLVGAVRRGRPPATLERRRFTPVVRAPAEAHHAVAEAVTGYVSLDLVLEVASALGGLPERTVVIEAEPESLEPSECLSPRLAAAVDDLLSLVRAEVEEVRSWMSEHRRTEQGDELTEDHAIEPQEGKPDQPYRPPRQPSQEQPDEPVQRGGEPGSEAGGDEPRKAPGS